VNSSRPRTGIREVARAAGVSVTTVSHALNGKGRLTDETRERVRRVASELGYRPSRNARNLVGRRTGLLGLAVSTAPLTTTGHRDFEYFTHLMLGATTAALDRGYALVLTPSHRELGQDIAVDGAIVVDPMPSDPLLRRLREADIPVVSTGRDTDDPGFTCWVDNDHVAGGRSVLDHLRRRGARRPALVTSPTRMSYTYDTGQAYTMWCAEHGVEPLIRYAEKGPIESEGFAIASELLALPEPPDAVYATYSRLAFGTAMAATARGVAVPDDLMIVTTATEAAGANTSQIPLTSVNLHPERLGRQAAELLVGLVEGEDPAPPRTIKTRLVARTSTKRPALDRTAR
jgi:DNA-binding LacI/PurR family transcriptional regulator